MNPESPVESCIIVGSFPTKVDPDPESESPAESTIVVGAFRTPTPDTRSPLASLENSRTAGRNSSYRTRFSARIYEGHLQEILGSPTAYKSKSRKNASDIDPPEHRSMNYIYPCDLIPTSIVPGPDTLEDSVTHRAASRGGLELSIRRWKCCKCSAVRQNLVRVALDGSGAIHPGAVNDDEVDQADNNEEQTKTPLWHPCLRCGTPPCEECAFATFHGEPIFTCGGRTVQSHWETPAWWRCVRCRDLTSFVEGDTFALLRADMRRKEGCSAIKCDSEGCGAAMQWDTWVYNDALITLGTFDGRVVATNGPWARHVDYHERHRKRGCGRRGCRVKGTIRPCKRGSCVDRTRKEIWYMPWKGFVRREQMEEVKVKTAPLVMNRFAHAQMGQMGMQELVSPYYY